MRRRSSERFWEEEEFKSFYETLAQESGLEGIAQFPQHGSTTRLMHSVAVAYYSYRLARSTRLPFHWEEMVSIDRRLQYVISFRSNCVLPYALYHGKFYIDKERLAITRVEFFLDMSDRDKATQAILYRKPFRLRFKPVEVSYVVDYADYGGKSYLHYVRNEIHFRCDWKRKLFSTSYAVVSEMVVTDIKPAEANIPAREAFGRRQIFSDDASLFFDKDFWGHYNIIKPDESLEKAVGRLRKMHEEEPSSQKATADAAATLSESTP